MSNYTKSTNFATKDNLTPGDPLKIVRGTEIDTEYNNIATAIATKTDNASAAITGGTINATTIGATTVSTGAFSSLSATGAITSTLATGTAPLVIASTTKVANLNVDSLDGADWASPAALGSTTPAAVSATTLTTSSTVTFNGGTANGVAYLNGSKVVTSGSALVFDGTNLGIGTSSPSAKLDVAGSVQIQSTGVFYLNNSDNTNQYYWQNIGATGANNATLILSRTNAGETLRIDASGNLGLGVTPSAWATYTALQIKNGSVANYSPTQDMRISSNAYYNAGWKYVASAYATQYLLDGSNGSHQFFTAPSGTAGNAITFTQAMTLSSAGELFLGATSAAFAEKLRMSGNYAVFENGTYTGFIGSGSSLGTATGSDFAIRSSNALAFLTGGATERARIDSSGNLLVGTTSQVSGSILSLVGGSGRNGAGIQVASGQTGIIYTNTGAYNYNAETFNYNGSQVGYIQVQSALTLYSTTSDYRLKTVIGSVTGSGERIDALNPIDYTMKSDGSQHRGFLAHEFQSVYANSVTETKDAVDNKGKPIYQGMQAGSAEVIADLVAEIQSLRKRLADAGI